MKNQFMDFMAEPQTEVVQKERKAYDYTQLNFKLQYTAAKPQESYVMV